MRVLHIALLAVSAVASPVLAADIAACHGGHRVTCVVDGDTLWWHGERLRLIDIDTPEAHSPKCEVQSPLAEAATDRLIELLGGGTPVIERLGTDVYRRTLARITVGGVDVGAALVDEGLARRYVPGERPWCG